MSGEVALSTMWSPKYSAMAEFVRDVKEFGFTHVELNSSLGSEALEELLSIGKLQVSSVHAPCPNLVTGDKLTSKLSLGSMNEDERQEAVRATQSTIDLAVKVRANVVLVHAGTVDMNPDMEKNLRKLHREGKAGSSEFEDLKCKLVSEREFMAAPHLEAVSESLIALADYAREQGIRIALENRVHYPEIPTLAEMLDILSQHSPEVVGYWHDVGHAEILDRTGFIPHEEWLIALKDRMIGVHLHDLKGLRDHQAPGIGDFNWKLIADNLPADVIKVCEIGEWNELEDARNAVSFLQSKGIV